MSAVRVVVFAYACEPDQGSEPGAGWLWARMLARMGGEVWVITRANNREVIERHLPAIDERDRLHFVYVDLPYWARFWKRGGRGLRLYYLLWQVGALAKARRLHNQVGFDLAWHLTIANVWLGSLAGLIGPPFVYGPVGGGVRTPWRLWRILGAAGIARDAVRASARAIARYLNPAARLAWRRASLILVQNPETRDWLPEQHRWKAEVFANPIFELPAPTRDAPRRRADVPTALFAGRLLPWKGVSLAIRALALMPGWRLLICGTGPDEARLRGLAERLNLQSNVQFLGWQTRERLLALMQDVDVFLFPSLHDDAGFVVVEASSLGLPVVCLDLGGPPCLGGTPVPPTGIDGTVNALADAVLAARGTTPRRPPTESSHRRRLAELLVERGLASSSQWKANSGRVPS
jgi:glycosyltransferase involved in cell wall biosynthesis